MLISARESLLRSAGLVARLIAPDLLASLETDYGPGWLERVNSNLTASGRRPGPGLDDPHLCLVVFAYDAAAGWAHESWRSMARVLLELLDRVDLGTEVTERQVARAFAIVDEFRREWGGPPAPRTIVVDDVVPEAQSDGPARTKWFSLSFSRGSGPDAWGDASVHPQLAAADLVWSCWGGDILEYLRPSLEQGWMPLEPPGARHLDLEVRWLGKNWKQEVLLAAASELTRTLLPSPPQRWDAYLVGFRLLLTRPRQ
jgi:hypothetical protein